MNFDYAKLEMEQIILHQEIQNIFDGFTLTGLYKNETKNMWLPFLKNLMDFFAKQEGPRGEKMKLIEEKMKEQEQQLQILLPKVLNLQFGKADIKDIEIALLNFSPCQYYTKYNGLKDNIANQRRDIQNLQNENSEFYQSIIQGLNKKSSLEESQKKIQLILLQKQQKLAEQELELIQVKTQMEQDENYQNYMKLMGIIQPYLDIWLEVDQFIGKDSNEKGVGLENTLQTYGIVDLVLNRIKQNKNEVEILTNIDWNNTPGEIDMLILRKSDNFPIAILESKARCFDIAHGYRQSGPERDPSKIEIKHPKTGQIIKIPFDIPCFIITVIPPNPFHLGFESKLKGDLNKYTLKRSNKEEDLDYEFIYQELSKIYNNYISPQQFLKDYSNLILVVPNDNTSS